MLVELAGKIADTDQPELANAFMAFILDPKFQSIIPTSNWSYPAALSEDQWPEAFSQLNYPSKALYLKEAEASDVRDKAIAQWRDAFSQ